MYGTLILPGNMLLNLDGVYYEAGYARAKNKPLILCCKKDKNENPHFDVAQINTIFDKDEKDLTERLKKELKLQ